MLIIIALLVLFFLCWGSFLNVVAYRLIRGANLFSRSRCPHCRTSIAWYDNIPLISYLFLRGSCRTCRKSISWLYPVIEIFTALVMTLLYLRIDSRYFLGHFLFFSGLIVTIRSDTETFLISRWTTIALVPIGILMSFTDHIPISPVNSIVASASGYLFLWIIAALFYLIAHREGVGHGDLDLLAYIGAFTGLLGIWATMLVGSLLGTVAGCGYLLYTRKFRRYIKLPFGPFLAIGAIIYVLFREPMLVLFGIGTLT